MTDKTYNGWTNYATWRVNLEWFDGQTGTTTTSVRSLNPMTLGLR